MKRFIYLSIGALIFNFVSALTIESYSSPVASQTYSLHVASETASVTETAVELFASHENIEEQTTLVKRWREAIVPRTTTKTTDAPPESWIRTISSSLVEVVHPTVIAGVTFSAKPTQNPGGGPTPWVSLNKQGRPKTIKPKVKNGVTKDISPDYKTYFKTATTIIHDNKDLKAHNLGKDEVFKEVKWIDEDDTYTSLNPLIRCTPDRYFNKGLAKDISSEPFCTPAENSNIDLDKTYFVTWYTKYFQDAEKVRIHIAYVREKEHSKGTRKRDLNELEFEYDNSTFSFEKREEAEEAFTPSGTKLAFFSSDWFDNRDGYFPLKSEEKWLKGKYSKRAIITIQPDTVEDEDFDLLTQGIIVNFRKAAVVSKKTREQLEDDGMFDNENKYIVLMTMPTVVVIAACVMYFLTQLCARDRDISKIRRDYYKSKFHRVIGKPKKYFNKKKGKKGYTNLPQFEEHELDEFKQN